MVQIIGPSRQALANEEMGRSLGEGLGNFAKQYYANKSLQSVLQDPSLKDAPLSKKQSALQMALQPHGELGEKIYEKRLGILQQEAGENMMKKAKAIANKPNATPADILFALIEGTQGVQGSEKFIAPAYQSLMQQMQAKAVSGAGNQAQNKEMGPQVQREGLPQFQIPGRTQQQQEQAGLSPQPVIQPSVGPEKKGLLQVPAQQKLPGRSAFISPEQLTVMEKQEMAAGGTGELSRAHAQSINQQIQAGERITQADREWLMSNQELERAREQSFRDYSQPKFEQEFGNLQPLEKARVDQYAKDIDRKDIESGVLNSPADLYEKTRKRMNDYITYKGRLEGSPVTKKRISATGQPEEYQEMKGGLQERPTIFNPSSVYGEAHLNKVGEQVRPLVLMGEDDEVRRILAGKGYYSDEQEDIIARTQNPEWKDQKKRFNSIGRGRNFKEIEGFQSPEKIEVARNKDVNKIYEGLQKSLTPSSSLILLMREAEHLGYDNNEFIEGLQKMRQNGYQLTPRQERDLPELEKPTMDWIRKIFG